MKKVLKIKWVQLALVFGLVLFFSTGTANAQRGPQNSRGPNFAQCDLNGDGVISANECRNGNFRQFDENRDGQLTRREFRQMNKNRKNGQGQGLRNGQRPRNGRNNGSYRGQNRPTDKSTQRPNRQAPRRYRG